MAHVHTHYDNLKVARDAPPEVIRAAYKTLCQKYHPDRHNDSAEAIRVIQIINTAYSVLSDPTKRRQHDEWIARAEADGGTRAEPQVDPMQSRHGHRPSHRSRQRSSSGMTYARQRPSHQLARAVHRALVSLEEFTKKLFRRA